MHWLLRELDNNLCLHFPVAVLKNIICGFRITDATFFDFVIIDNVAVIFYRYRSHSDISWQSVFKETNLLFGIIPPVIPMCPVITILRVLSSTKRHCERRSVCFCNRDITDQLLQVCHIVLNKSSCQILSRFTICQFIMDT